jgi:hypothetical protein
MEIHLKVEISFVWNAVRKLIVALFFNSGSFLARGIEIIATIIPTMPIPKLIQMYT